MPATDPIDTSREAPPHLVQAGIVVRVVIAIAMVLTAFLPWATAPDGTPVTGEEWYGAGVLALCGGMLLSALLPLGSRRAQIGLASAISTALFALGALWLATGPVRHGGQTLVRTRVPHLFKDMAWVAFAVAVWQTYVHAFALSQARKSRR